MQIWSMVVSVQLVSMPSSSLYFSILLLPPLSPAFHFQFIGLNIRILRYSLTLMLLHLHFTEEVLCSVMISGRKWSLL